MVKGKISAEKLNLHSLQQDEDSGADSTKQKYLILLVLDLIRITSRNYHFRRFSSQILDLIRENFGLDHIKFRKLKFCI